MERARWTDDRFNDKMSGIDTTFDHVFEELRADRAELRAEMRAMRGELKAEMHGVRGDVVSLAGRLDRIQDRLVQIGFGMTGVFAAGLIALVATQL